jgi:hypothetical protein
MFLPNKRRFIMENCRKLFLALALSASVSTGAFGMDTAAGGAGPAAGPIETPLHAACRGRNPEVVEMVNRVIRNIVQDNCAIRCEDRSDLENLRQAKRIKLS